MGLRPELLHVLGPGVPGVPRGEVVGDAPERPRREPAERRALEELVAEPVRVHDARAHHGHGARRDDVARVEEPAQQRRRHQRQGAGPVGPDDPVDFGAGLQQEVDGVVGGLGAADDGGAARAPQRVEVRARVDRVDDGRGEAGARPRRHDGVRGGARGVDELGALDGRAALDREAPAAAAPGEAGDVGDLGLQARAPDEVVVPGEVVEVVVDGGARDVAVLGDALVPHGVEGVLEQADLHLREEARVDLLLAPHAADGGLLVEDDEVGIRSEVEIRLGPDQAVPTCADGRVRGN